MQNWKHIADGRLQLPIAKPGYEHPTVLSWFVFSPEISLNLAKYFWNYPDAIISLQLDSERIASKRVG